MSITYKIQSGDTLESISRRQYGSESYADLISDANPGLTENMIAGTEITIPGNPDVAESEAYAPAANENEVAILINGKRFRFWESVRLTRSVDTIWTVEFTAPFYSDLSEFRSTFKPFSYQSVVVTVGGELFFTGTMIGVTPVVDIKKKYISVSCYAKPGVLNDCTPPASAFPLEFNNQGLKNIAARLVRPFGIGVKFDADQGAIFERVACEPGKKVLPFLSELAKQRDIVISSTKDGALLFSKSVSGIAPVAKLLQGNSPVVSVSSFFSNQEYYSHITGLEPVIVGLAGSQFTVKNPRLPGVVRPYTFAVNDTHDADVQAAVKSKSGRMFGNMVAYSVKVSTWRDPGGSLWQPNTIVSLESTDSMIYNPYDFVVRGVEFERDSKKEHATLDLVMPGSFSGEVPEVLPWEE